MEEVELVDGKDVYIVGESPHGWNFNFDFVFKEFVLELELLRVVLGDWLNFFDVVNDN